MKSFVVLRLASIVLSISFLACSNKPTKNTLPPGPQTRTDSGVTGGVDAGPNAGSDAGPQFDDAGSTESDAGQAASGMIRVIIQDDGNGVPGIDILLSDDDGNYLSHHQSGMDGIAELEIDANTTVSILARFPSGPSNQFSTMRQTYVGVNPGDTIRLGDMDGGKETTFVGSGSLALLLPSLAEDADEIVLNTGCEQKYVSSSSASEAIVFQTDFYSDCVTADSKINVLITAIKDNEVVAYAIASDINVSDVIASTATVSVSAWRTDFDALQIQVKNPRAGSLGSNAELLMIHEGAEFQAGERFGLHTSSGVTIDLPVVKDFGQAHVLQLGTLFGGGFGSVPDALTFYRKKVNMMVPSAYEVDLMADVVPPLLDFELDKSTAPRWTIKWRIGDGPSIADAMFASFEWFENMDDHSWIVHLPPDRQGPWQLPEMPERFAQFRADSMDPQMPSRMFLFSASFIDGYSDYIANHGPQLFENMPESDHVISASFGGFEF